MGIHCREYERKVMHREPYNGGWVTPVGVSPTIFGADRMSSFDFKNSFCKNCQVLYF